VVPQRQTVTVDPVREAAYRSLHRVTEKAGYVNIVVDATLERYNWPDRDRSLYTTLVYGTLRHQGLIDWVLAQRIGKKFPRKIHPPILTVLRMGAYQILFLSRTPKYAVVNESVNLAKRHGHAGSAGLVNAVLRAIPRDPDAIELPGKEENPALYIATRYSHPLWIVERWIQAWGIDRTEQLCAANNDVAPLTVRANTLKGDVEQLEARLRAERVSVRKNTDVPEELEIVGSPRPVRALRSYRDGLFHIQDAASVCACHLLAPTPGETVIDLCAGPGGKTTHLAQLMRNEGIIYAMDIKPHKLRLIRESCVTLGVTIVRCLEADARRVSELGVPQADRVLVDAPCTGTGTFRRRVDLKWRVRSDDFERLAGMQRELIAAAASVVKSGGIVVYSVCSIDPAETDEVVAGEFLQRNNLALEETSPSWMSRFRTGQKTFRIAPGDGGMDGFFMAKLVKMG
jgi:16S rRNA (cytosine967-C5)-methyltransferase